MTRLTALLSLVLLNMFINSCCKEEERGLNSLINIENLPGSTICPAGGLIIQSGLDLNRNNVLDSSEVDSTHYLCNGQSSGAYDKVILLPLNFSANTTSTTPVVGGQLIHFSKLNYLNVDSIIFVANPYVGNTSNHAILKLYDLTNNTEIINSTIKSNSLYSNTGFYQTGNLINYLPSGEITLGGSLNSETDGQFAGTGTTFLILYRP